MDYFRIKVADGKNKYLRYDPEQKRITSSSQNDVYSVF